MENWHLPSVVGDMPLLEVELVEQCLAIEEVVVGLRAHLEQARTTSQEASSQPGGNPACGRGSVGMGMANQTKEVLL